MNISGTFLAHSPTADDQIMLEGDCVEQAVRKYRDSVRVARVADTMPGPTCVRIPLPLKPPHTSTQGTQHDLRSVDELGI